MKPSNPSPPEIVDGRAVETPAPAAGQYWLCIHEPKKPRETEPRKGDLVLVYSVDEDLDEIALARGKHNWTYSAEEFLRTFTFCPDGQDRFLQEFGSLLNATAASQQAAEQAAGLADLAADDAEPNLLPATFDASQDDPTPSAKATAIAPTRQSSIASADVRMRDMRLALKRYQIQARQQSEKIQSMLEAQRTLLQHRVERMQAMVAKAEEAVWTLGLYLGKDDKIVRLAKGPKPPAETKIVIRQLVLHMDEECAIAHEHEDGPFDYKKIDSFDKWLRDPRHLEQVLPEPRGVVAIKPRRTPIDYGDPRVNSAKNAENRKTYWLMRNGDSLYRIWTALDVDEVIVPKRDEFEKLMRTDPFWHHFNDVDRDPPKPGSKDWMKAMRRVDERRKHYMRILLFLQGLIDRTKVFWPLPGSRINIMRERVHAEHVDYVYDGDEAGLLPTGRPAFRDWLRSINQRLEIGHRIVGAFPYGQDENSRVHPRCYEQPANLKLYNVHKRPDAGWSLLFERTETIYPRDWKPAHRPKKRASYDLDPGDDFFVNFDLADVADMQFYLHDRVNRYAYAKMFPVLKTALALKAQEAADEAPFRQLLAGEILKIDLAGAAAIERALPELVLWWKYKVHEHRALLSDDAKALRMIIGEFRRRWCVLHDDVDHANTLTQLTTTFPCAVIIAYAGHREYVVFLPENDANVFVREIHWRDGQVVEERPWTLLDARLQSWLVLHQPDRGTVWPRDLRREHFLTGPEIEQALPRVRELFAEHTKEEQRQRRDRGQKTAVDTLLRITGKPREHRIYLYVFSVNRDHREGRPTIDQYHLVWKRTRSGDLELTSLGWPNTYGLSWPGPWTDDTDTYWTNPDGQTLVQAAIESENNKMAGETRKHDHQYLHQLVEQIHDEQIRLYKEKARQEYKEEYGDDDTFEEEHKSKHWDQDVWWSTRARRALSLVLDKDIDVDGMTVSEVFVRAKKLGFKHDKFEDRQDEHNEAAGVPFPWKLVLQTAPKPKPLEADEASEADETDDDEDEE